MATLSKLSGESALWTGEQGARRLGQMNNSIAGATGLKSIEDVTVFSVADQLMKSQGIKDEAGMDAFLGKDAVYTGTYVDTMQLMEQGLKSPTVLRNLMKSVQGMEGMGNTAGQIERYKNMFDLNYAGASQVWQMSQNGDFMENPDKYAGQIKDIQTNIEYKSDSQKLQDALTKLATEGVNMGKLAFDDAEIPHLADAVEQMKLIHGDLARKLDGPIADPYTGLPGSHLANAESILKGSSFNDHDIIGKISDSINGDEFKRSPVFGEFMEQAAVSMTSPKGERGAEITSGEMINTLRRLNATISNWNNNHETRVTIFNDGA
jgi:hypothetical protein